MKNRENGKYVEYERNGEKCRSEILSYIYLQKLGVYNFNIGDAVISCTPQMTNCYYVVDDFHHERIKVLGYSI